MLPSSPRRRYQLLMVAVAVALAGYVFWRAWVALTPFFVGAILALVFAPAVNRVEARLPYRLSRPGLARATSLAAVYLVGLGALIGAGLLILPPVIDQTQQFVNDAPSFVTRAREELERGSTFYRERVPPEIQARINKITNQLAQDAGRFAQDALTRTVTFFTGSLLGLVGYIVVPFWLWFVLKDKERGVDAFVRWFPASVQEDARQLVERANRVVGSYVRAQLLLATLSGIVTWFGLYVFGIRFSVVLGLIAGVSNLIPVLGPMVGGIPALIVTAATHPGWTVLWVFLFLFIWQNLKDYLIVPRVQGQAVNLHPAVILVLLVLAGHLAGFWGLLIVVPVAAVVRDTFSHVYRRLATPSLAEAGAAPGEPAHAREGEPVGRT